MKIPGWNFFWNVMTLKAKVVAIGVVLLVVLVGFGGFKACSWWKKRSAKIDQATIEKLKTANEAERKAELSKTIQENADVVKTVDGRNTIAEVDETQRNAQINAKIAEADAAIAKAKERGHDVTGPELECILTGACP